MTNFKNVTTSKILTQISPSVYLSRYLFVYFSVHLLINYICVFNSASSICNSFFVYWRIPLHLLRSLFLIISRKANGRCKRFYDGELSSPTWFCIFVLEFCNFVFFMEVESNFIKEVSFAKMSDSFTTVEIIIERTFFAFSPFIYLLVGSQGCPQFLLELLVN